MFLFFEISHIFRSLSLFFWLFASYFVNNWNEIRRHDTLENFLSFFFFFGDNEAAICSLLVTVYFISCEGKKDQEKITEEILYECCVAQIMRDKFECESSCHKFTVQTISTKLFLLWHICTLQLHCVWHRTWTKLEWCQECNERINVVQMTMFIEMVQLSNWTHTHTHFRF